MRPDMPLWLTLESSGSAPTQAATTIYPGSLRRPDDQSPPVLTASRQPGR